MTAPTTLVASDTLFIMNPATGQVTDIVSPAGVPSGMFTTDPVKGPVALGVAVAFGGGASYLGQVASNTYLPAQLSASNVQSNWRSMKFARDKIASLQIAYPSWYSNSETPTGANMTLSASIEYPAGTYTQVKWAGSTSVVVASGALSPLSDVVTVAIPKNAQFWVRTWNQCSAGAIFTAQVGTVSGNFSELGASGLTDKTMSGSISGTGPYDFGPCLIVSQTTKPSVLIIGDSIENEAAYTNNSTTQDFSGDYGVVARSIGPNFGYTKYALTGDSIATFNANCAKRKLLIPYFTHLIDEFGRNDVDSSATAATILAGYATLQQNFAALKVCQTTIPPKSTSSDNWATVANQTAATTSGVAQTVNQAIRAGLPNFERSFDIAGPLETATDSSIWQVGLIYLDGNGVHPSAAGNQVIRKSGIFSPALITR